MSIVLDRIANGNVHLPPEALVQPRIVRRPNLGAGTTRWLRWRSSGLSYSRIRGGNGGDESADHLGGAPNEGSGLSWVTETGLLRLVCTGEDAKLQQTTLTLIVVWFTLSFGTYGVSTWNNVLFTDVGLSNPYLCSFIFCVASLPGNLASIGLVERVSGRNERTQNVIKSDVPNCIQISPRLDVLPHNSLDDWFATHLYNHLYNCTFLTFQNI